MVSENGNAMVMPVAPTGGSGLADSVKMDFGYCFCFSSAVAAGAMASVAGAEWVVLQQMVQCSILG